MGVDRRSIVLTGFMGVGKSTVGVRLAERLGWPFIDLDDRIEAATGRSIPELFAEGEPTFRWHEAQQLRQLPMGRPIVLATGGGTLIGYANQRVLQGARLVWLDAPLDVLRERLREGSVRPLAADAERLYAQRRAAYERIPHRVDVARLSPDEVVEAVLALPLTNLPERDATATRLDVAQPHGDPYPILIGEGVAAEVGEWLAGWEVSHVALITDEMVGRLWGEPVRHDLMTSGCDARRLEMGMGEHHKHLGTVARLYDDMAAAWILRGGAVLALGGGVVSDVAGFVAATWMRGVRRLVQVPTTLLAMVDASVGGKTGVDHPAGKNLIGAFRFPDLVLIDPRFLQTLPPRELRNGLAEVIKHGVIADPELFEAVARHRGPLDQLVTADLIARAVQVKVEIVRRDPFERGERALLNLGHTFGHAYELASEFALTHGEAVAVGIVTAARLGERLGLSEPGLTRRIVQVMEQVGLPITWQGAPAEAVWQAMQQDKKRATRGLRLVLPRIIGQCVLTEPGEVRREHVLEVLRA